MAYFDTMPEFNGKIRKFETTDPAHADLFNALVGTLINNDVFLRNLANHLLQSLEEHIADKRNPHNVSKAQLGIEKVNNTSDNEKPVSTAQQDALDAAYQQTTGYVDQAIANLINGAPSTLDTLGEIAQAMEDNADVVQALNAAIGKKADTGHVHDERYYTEAEINNKMAGKANSSHTHTKSQITDFPTSLPASDVYSWAKALSKPGYTWGEIRSKPESFPPSAHTHSYLPLTGGTITGNISMGTNAIYFCDGKLKSPAGQQLYIAASDEWQFELFLGVKTSMWTFCPGSDGGVRLGHPNYRWDQIYSSVPAISTSDKNKKKDVTHISDKYLDFFALLQPVTYKFIDGASGRTHVGFIAQDVESAMAESGLSDLDFAGFCRDKKLRAIHHKKTRQRRDAYNNLLTNNGVPVMEEYEEITYEEEYDSNGNPVFVYALRYEEFIAINTAVLQRQQQKINMLEESVLRLEQLLSLQEKNQNV